MFGRTSKKFFEMSKEQYKEMFWFYRELGYDEKQSKLLSSQCFGYEIKASSGTAYRPDWEFYFGRESLFPKGMVPPTGAPTGGLRGLARASLPKGSAMNSTESVSVSAEPEDGVFCDVMSMFSNAPACGSAEPVPFSTAKTKTADENRPSSPADNSKSIFSANVNKASWSYLRNCILRKKHIDGDFIRVEEIINSYPYTLRKPENDDLFSVTAEKTECPWNDEKELLFVGLNGKEVTENVKQNLVFLVDVSGSMEERWILVQMSLMSVIGKLREGDKMSIISYSNETTVVCENIDCGDKDECIRAVMSVEGTGGGTYGSDGLENAYRILKENYDENANNRIFIFTDGDFNFGISTESGLGDFIYEKRKTGIYLSVVGYGMSNFKDDNMESLARKGNGNYSFVGNPYDIIDSLNENLQANLITIAKDVKICVEFNPNVVKSYRLIGYNVRGLTEQEFNDTEKAVDGIGSGHKVVALFEIETGKAQQNYSSRYIKKTVENNDEELAYIEIRYKDTDNTNKSFSCSVQSDISEKSINSEISAYLAMFGLYVTDSDYKGKADKKLLEKMLSEFEQNDNIDTKKKYGHFDIIERYLKNR